MTDQTTHHPMQAKPAVDIDALLAAGGLDDVLQETRTTLVDDEAKVAAIRALQREDRELAAKIKADGIRREAIRKLIKGFIRQGDDNLVVNETFPAGPEPAVLEVRTRVVAKMSYPEPTVSVNTAYIKEHYPYPAHREFYTVRESTPRLLVQEIAD